MCFGSVLNNFRTDSKSAEFVPLLYSRDNSGDLNTEEQMDDFLQLCVVVHSLGFVIAMVFPALGFPICALAMCGVQRYRPFAVG